MFFTLLPQIKKIIITPQVHPKELKSTHNIGDAQNVRLHSGLFNHFYDFPVTSQFYDRFHKLCHTHYSLPEWTCWSQVKTIRSHDGCQLFRTTWCCATSPFKARWKSAKQQCLAYNWTLEFFKKLGIGEWDSFCEKCIMGYSKKSNDVWKNSLNSIL